MVHTCLRCGHEFKLKSDLKRHLQRKKPCAPKYSEMSREECIQNIDTIGKQKIKGLQQIIKKKDNEIKDLKKEIKDLMKLVKDTVKNNTTNNSLILFLFQCNNRRLFLSLFLAND